MSGFCGSVADCFTRLFPSLFALFCFIAYVVVLVAILRNWDVFATSFYRLLICLSIADCGDLIRTVLFPVYHSTLSQPNQPQIYGFFSYLFWTVEVLSLLAIAFNRLTFIVWPFKADQIWTVTVTNCTILLIWTVGVGFGVVPTLACCRYVYDPNTLYVHLDGNLQGARLFLLVGFSLDVMVVSSILIIYGYCLWALRNWRRIYGLLPGPQLQRRKRVETNLLVQACLMTSLLISVDVTYALLVLLKGESGDQWGEVRSGLAAAYIILTRLFNGLNPFIYMALNKVLRQKVQQMYYLSYSQLEDYD